MGSNPGQDRLELKEWHPNSADKTPLQDRANKGCTLRSFWPRSKSKPLLWINIPISMPLALRHHQPNEKHSNLDDEPLETAK